MCISFIDAQKSQCSSLSDGESFECYGESELVVDNNNASSVSGEGVIVGGGVLQVTTTNNHNNNSMSRLAQSSMTMNGNGQPLSPTMTSDSSGGDPELSMNNSSTNG